MPKVSQVFPSRFLSGDEIMSAQVPVVIKKVESEVVKNFKTNKEEQVYVIYFEGKERGVRLGKTRANEVKDITGLDDMDDWKGQKVTLYTEPMRAFGEVFNVIHFKKEGDMHGELPTIQVDEAERIAMEEAVDMSNIPM